MFLDNSYVSSLYELMGKSQASEVGLAAARLSGAEEILINAEKRFHPASTIKICIMMEVFHQNQQGVLSLYDPIMIKNRFLSIADGSSYSLDMADDSEKDLYSRVGESFPVRELVRRMIAASSNLATNLLVELVRPDPVSRFMSLLGAPELIVRRGIEDKPAYKLGWNNSATAHGLMKILLKLARREVVSTDDSDQMMEILSGQLFNEMIPAQLPLGVQVAHKTGSIQGHYHDAGIVYPPRAEPFVLVILTKGYPEREERAAHAFVASLARAVYDHWSAA